MAARALASPAVRPPDAKAGGGGHEHGDEHHGDDVLVRQKDLDWHGMPVYLSKNDVARRAHVNEHHEYLDEEAYEHLPVAQQWELWRKTRGQQIFLGDRVRGDGGGGGGGGGARARRDFPA